ncbi:hypothetical protein J8273_7566 [Carpediemonas membranifera]|uniref:Uncharacterized protein n=1 Tax=Carpediemonas membranifera TaxID=201153 RepID=A0A8J6BVF6_9EUKA|nr:hypothetical protein J8273_7566 [Carpediemonas membranifera]|eukprot:KAG9391356.1 hypothetical protein J8273_7566 [Carpediemonas membranifera]
MGDFDAAVETILNRLTTNTSRMQFCRLLRRHISETGSYLELFTPYQPRRAPRRQNVPNVPEELAGAVTSSASDSESVNAVDLRYLPASPDPTDNESDSESDDTPPSLSGYVELVTRQAVSYYWNSPRTELLLLTDNRLHSYTRASAAVHSHDAGADLCRDAIVLQAMSAYLSIRRDSTDAAIVSAYLTAVRDKRAYVPNALKQEIENRSGLSIVTMRPHVFRAVMLGHDVNLYFVLHMGEALGILTRADCAEFARQYFARMRSGASFDDAEFSLLSGFMPVTADRAPSLTLQDMTSAAFTVSRVWHYRFDAPGLLRLHVSYEECPNVSSIAIATRRMQTHPAVAQFLTEHPSYESYLADDVALDGNVRCDTCE